MLCDGHMHLAPVLKQMKAAEDGICIENGILGFYGISQHIASKGMAADHSCEAIFRIGFPKWFGGEFYGLRPHYNVFCADPILPGQAMEVFPGQDIVMPDKPSGKVAFRRGIQIHWFS